MSSYYTYKFVAFVLIAVGGLLLFLSQTIPDIKIIGQIVFPTGVFSLILLLWLDRFKKL